MPTKRQQQVSRLIQQAVSMVFQTKGMEMWKDAFVTITTATVTPYLSIARIYLSAMNYPNVEDLIRILEANAKIIRKLMGEKIRHQVRHIPLLEFYHDSSSEEAAR